MTSKRVQAGALGGISGLVPLVLVVLLTKLGVLNSDAATSATLFAFVFGIILSGMLAGYMAGQARRRRTEFKAIIGALAGVVAGVIYGAALETVFIVRYVAIAPDLREQTIGTHPLRVTFAIILMCTIIIAVAMLTTQFTAKPLPSPRPGRRTRELPIVPPQQRGMQQPISPKL